MGEICYEIGARDFLYVRIVINAITGIASGNEFMTCIPCVSLLNEDNTEPSKSGWCAQVAVVKTETRKQRLTID